MKQPLVIAVIWFWHTSRCWCTLSGKLLFEPELSSLQPQSTSATSTVTDTKSNDDC